MQENDGFGDILDLVRDLRKRCDFDRALTLETLRPYLREELAEFEEAIEQRDEHRIASELGDILLHCAFQLVLAEERGAFNLAAVSERLVQKMKARHPHLYGDGPKPHWERHKVEERRREAERLGEQPSVLGHLPHSLPELERAFRYQERAAAVGFDWPDLTGPLDKLEEEVRETREHPAQEIGDVLFAAVNVARKAGVHPSSALRQATEKFKRRFHAIERSAAARGVDIHTAGLDALDRLWDEVKSVE
ncbi:MAG TPA: nucleoside triphosphate pyrophosphohydrolase [Gemmatimonadales bacterium]|nr:nucleoside triphosphate pyrophosphohydrolase [Gemmatimonadales bacterium]